MHAPRPDNTLLQEDDSMHEVDAHILLLEYARARRGVLARPATKLAACGGVLGCRTRQVRRVAPSERTKGEHAGTARRAARDEGIAWSGTATPPPQPVRPSPNAD